MPSGDYQKDKIRLEKNIRVAGFLQASWRKQMKRLIGKFKPTILTSRHGGEYTLRYLEVLSSRIIGLLGKRIESLDRVYSDFLDEYSVERPEAGKPRGPKVINI